ncbi:hypothetical protein LguiA_034816 [Lonicera macranthoides]
MAEEQQPVSEPPIPDDEDEFEDDDEDEDFEEEEESPVTEKIKVQNQLLRLTTSNVSVPLRVHDVFIKGNNKTKEALIEAEVEILKSVTSLQELVEAAGIAKDRLRRLEIFDSANITLNPGPPELPGTANVVIEVVENQNPLTGSIGVFSKPEARSSSLEGSLKLKNMFGYGDIWDGSFTYGWDQMSEVSAGVYLPRFKKLVTPTMARVSLLTEDWLKLSSYKERSLGLSLGLISSEKHHLAYNLTWRTLTDSSQMSSSSVRRQLGHGLLSALKYTFKIDRRDSPVRPTRGYAFVSTSQIGGLVPDYRSLHFFRQELDLRCAIPLGFSCAALNLGIASGVVIPWGRGFLERPSSLPDRFFLGGSSSPVCNLGGPTSLLGFKPRGVGPAESRRETSEKSYDENSNTSGVDFIGGDLAVTAFADLSFDLPLRVLRESGIHAHAFACTGSLNKLTESAFQDFSFSKFRNSFRSSAGFGIILPTKLFRMEVNYCYILKQHEHDLGKTGLQFSFSSPL